MIQNKMAEIINRTKERANRKGLTTEEKEIYSEVYSELIGDYLGREPSFTDVSNLVEDFIDQFSVTNKKKVLKMKAVMEIYAHFIQKDLAD